MKILKKAALLVGMVLMAGGSAGAMAQTTWYAWDSGKGLVAYDADTGVATDLPGPSLYNLSLGLNPVNGEMWGFTGNTVYSVNIADGSFSPVHTLSISGEASSFDLAGNFYVTQSSNLYQINLTTGAETLVQNIGINPDGFDILPDGRWIANDTGTIYLLDSNWNLQSQWSGPASETISADEAGRVFGSNGTDLHEIDIVNQTSTLLWSDNTASQIFGSEAYSGGVFGSGAPVSAEPVPTMTAYSLGLTVLGLLILAIRRLRFAG